MIMILLAKGLADLKLSASRIRALLIEDTSSVIATAGRRISRLEMHCFKKTLDLAAVTKKNVGTVEREFR